MKPFHFKEFILKQSIQVFRVGTDGVLLGVLANVRNAQTILEVGTGTGLISLMLAQRNNVASILALDINEESVSLSTENFNNSPFKDRIKGKKIDYKIFEPKEKFDLIVSNPPYFDINSSEKDVIARQRTELNFDDLIKKSSELLSLNGKLSVIIPSTSAENLREIALAQGLYLIRKVRIFGSIIAGEKRCVLEFSLKEDLLAESSIIIEKSPRVYSDDYLELTKDFHIFNKKSD